VINVRTSGFAPAHTVAARAPHRGARGFWLLFAIEALFVAGMLALALALVLPSRAPLARSADFATVRDAVWARVNGTINDPLTDIAPGISVRASSVRGFTLNGRIYYYYFEGQRGFDPLSRGAVAGALSQGATRVGCLAVRPRGSAATRGRRRGRDHVRPRGLAAVRGGLSATRRRGRSWPGDA